MKHRWNKTQLCAGVLSQEQCRESAVLIAIPTTIRNEFLPKIYGAGSPRRGWNWRLNRLRRLSHLPAMYQVSHLLHRLSLAAIRFCQGCVTLICSAGGHWRRRTPILS